MRRLTGAQDAFGQAMYDCFAGKQPGAVIERDDGFVDPCDVSGYFGEYKHWPEHQRKAIRLARGKVLDVGCGAGRVALYLQSKGLDVTGIDISPLAARVCKLGGLKKAKVISATQVTARLGLFDTVVMYGNNFGLLGNVRSTRRFLKRLHKASSPSARILAETLDPYDTKDPSNLAYHRRNRRRGRMPGQVRIRVRYRDLATPYFDVLFVSKDEMQQVLAGTGWKVSRFFDSNGSSYIAVIEKQQSS